MKIALTLLGAFLFLFIYWKRLKEDYSSNIIFTSAIYVMLGIGLFEVISSKFIPLWWFWLGLLGTLLGFGVAVLRYRLRFYETLEALIVSVIPWLSFVFLANSIRTSDLASLFVFVSIVLMLPIFYFFDARYKRFVWYRSGRIGFSGLTTVGIFFLLRAVVAVFFSNVLSFVGTVDALLSAVLAFSAFLAVFSLARTAT